MKPIIEIAHSGEEWTSAAAKQVIALANAAIDAKGEFSLVLSGGGTPKPVYRQLASWAAQIDWQNTYIFWGDERCVPPDDPQSNYRMAKESLLDHVPVPDQNVFRMLGEIDPVAAAQDYEETLAAYFHDKEKRFDLILLGIGEDGHTASLFPGTPALTEDQKWVAANPHPYSDTTRLTLTYPAINAARQVIFLASGEGKAPIIADIINNPDGPPPFPAKRVAGLDQPPMWILDQGAAGNLSI